MKWRNLITWRIWPTKRRKYLRDSINFNKLTKYIQQISPSPSSKSIITFTKPKTIKFIVTIKNSILMLILIKISHIKNRKVIVWADNVVFIGIPTILYFLVKH